MAPEGRRSRIARRASDRCEYCHLRQVWEPFSTFHIEHILPRQHSDDDSDDNLCLSCSHCNLHKGPNLSGIDPDSVDLIVSLFHPRRDRWDEHFEWAETLLLGKTALGRATVQVLAINAAQRIELREELTAEGYEL